MFNKKSLFALAAFVFLVLNVHAAEAEKLEWKFTQGQEFTITNQINLNITTSVPIKLLTDMGVPSQSATDEGAADETQNAVATGAFDFDWDVSVKEVRPDQSAVLDLLLSKAFLKINAHMGDDQFNYESDLLNPAPNGTAQGTVPEADRRIELVVAPNGAIIAANGENISQTLDGLVSQLQQQQINISKEQLESLAKMFLNFHIRYPEQALTVGDKWNENVDLSSIIPLGEQEGDINVSKFDFQIAQDWKLAGKNGSILDIKEMSDAMPQFALAFETKDADIAVDASGKEKGTLLVNALNGMLQSIERELELRGTFTLQDKKNNNESWEIPFHFSLQSKLNVTQ